MNCHRCGTTATAQARFCTACGAALSQVPQLPPVRKHVVVFFVDIVGSTALGERLDPEPLRRYLKRYFDTVSAVLWRHGGAVEKFIGDAVMAVFGVPVAREDDAARAARAAVELHSEVAALSADLEREYGQQLRVRVGVNGGEVFVARNADGQFSVTGDTVNTAARLEQAAGAGETLVGGTVAHLAADAVALVAVEPLQVKGKAAALAAWRIDTTAPPPGRPGPRTALVGRGDELADLHRIADRVRRRRDTCLVTVLGSAGIGKSRLVGEFAAGLDGWRVLEGGCPSYSSGATFWPLALILEQLGEDWPTQVGLLLHRDRDGDLVRDRLATAVGASDEGTSLDDIVWAARRLVEALCADRPLLLIFEDLHWASPTFIEFVDRLSAGLRSVPALIACVARPELLEAYPMWGGGRSFATAMPLSPLTPDAVRELIDDLAADVVAHTASTDTAWVPDIDRLSVVSEGNPLILGQLMRFGPTGAELPASLQTLFEARLDQLDPADRLFCECAAVIGRDFWANAVRQAADFADRPDADWHATLERLQRLDIITTTRARNGGRPDYRFTHTLLMETIYRATPKSQRSQWHSKVATWLGTAHGLGTGERSELIAHHFERAHALLIQISRQDPHGAVLACAAGEAAVLASGHCMARSDLPAAVRLLGDAQRLLPADHRRHYDVARWLFDCLISMGAMDDASAALDRTDTVLIGDPLWGLLGAVPRAALGLRQERIGRDEAHEVARRLIEGEDRADPGTLLWAHELDALAFSADMDMRAAERSAHRALVYARAAGDRRAESRLLCGLCEMAFWGPTPVGEARTLCQSSLQLNASDLRLTAPVLAMLAGLHAMEGDHATADDLLHRSYEITVDLQLPGAWIGLRQYSCLVAMARGDYATAAEDCLSALADLPAEDAAAALFRAMAARARLLGGDLVAAAELLGWRDGVARVPSPDQDPHYQGLWYGVGARLSARAGEWSLAARWADQAVAVTSTMDSPRVYADALVDAGTVHRVLGDVGAAHRAFTEAREQYLAKGATQLAAMIDPEAGGLV